MRSRPWMVHGEIIKTLANDSHMAQFIKKHYKHLIYWGVLGIYLAVATPIYTHFFIHYGKPEGVAKDLPTASDAITYNMVELRPVIYQGESLYELKGFAFMTASPIQVNKITIVLIGNGKSIAFSTNSVPYPDMIESYPKFQPGMETAEFSMLISKDVLSPGIYQIGVLLEDQEGPDRAYTLTTSTIKQTPNTISFATAQ